MSDPLDMKNVPGMDQAASGFATASKSMQSFAAEMQKMSKTTLESTTHLMEQLRGAKTIEEVVSLQTNFMQQSFASYSDYTKRFSELMMALPMELAKQGQAAFQQGTGAIKQATEQAGEQVKHATEQFNQHHG